MSLMQLRVSISPLRAPVCLPPSQLAFVCNACMNPECGYTVIFYALKYAPPCNSRPANSIVVRIFAWNGLSQPVNMLLSDAPMTCLYVIRKTLEGTSVNPIGN